MKLRVILLAGGKSRRMGVDKLFLPFHGLPIIIYIINKILKAGFDVSIISNQDNKKRIGEILHSKVNQVIPIFADLLSDKGPIGGIYSGLYYSLEPYIFVLAVDLPFFKTELMIAMEKYLPENDVVVPKMQNGFEPLFCFYKKTCQPILLKMIEENDLKISNCYNKLITRILYKDEILTYDKELISFLNINTKEDYELILKE